MFSGTLEHVLNMFNRTLEGISYPVVYFPLSFSVNIKQLETDLFWPLKGLIFHILNKSKDSVNFAQTSRWAFLNINTIKFTGFIETLSLGFFLKTL